MRVLRVFHVMFVASIALPLFAQNKPSPVPAACGDLRVSMAVDLDNGHRPVAQPEAGKALIYFIQDTGTQSMAAYPTTKIGIDGKWVGANKKGSFFFVSVTPGEHHLCAAAQSRIIEAGIELAHLNAEAGKVYYYRTRFVNPLTNDRGEYLFLMPVDGDEGQYLEELYPHATAHARK